MQSLFTSIVQLTYGGRSVWLEGKKLMICRNKTQYCSFNVTLFHFHVLRDISEFTLFILMMTQGMVQL